MDKQYYWFCPHCNCEVGAYNVTFEETCAICGWSVETREIIKDWCDMNFSSITFTITKIEQEKRIDGVTKIYFVPNDGEKYISDFYIVVALTNTNGDRTVLRELMLATYEQCKIHQKDNAIKIGDII